MRVVLGFRSMVAFGLVAMASVVASWADDPAASAQEKEKLKRWEQQFRESLDWYQVFAGRDPREPLKPQAVLRWVNPTRGQKGEPTLLLWVDAGRPEALSSVYPWDGNLIYECISLARDAGLTAREGGRAVWTPAVAGVTFREVPDAPVPSKAPASRLGQMRGIAEQFKVTLIGGNAGVREREELRLLPKPIYRYDLERAKAAHPDLVDGAVFAFVQGTDPEAVLMVEAVRRGDRTIWQYALARATGWTVEAKLGPSVVWTTANLPTWNDSKLPGFVLGRPLVD